MRVYLIVCSWLLVCWGRGASPSVGHSPRYLLKGLGFKGDLGTPYLYKGMSGPVVCDWSALGQVADGNPAIIMNEGKFHVLTSIAKDFNTYPYFAYLIDAKCGVIGNVTVTFENQINAQQVSSVTGETYVHGQFGDTYVHGLGRLNYSSGTVEKLFVFPGSTRTYSALTLHNETLYCPIQNHNGTSTLYVFDLATGTIQSRNLTHSARFLFYGERVVSLGADEKKRALQVLLDGELLVGFSPGYDNLVAWDIAGDTLYVSVTAESQTPLFLTISLIDGSIRSTPVSITNLIVGIVG